MAVVFVLGPSEWREARPGPTPMDIRRRMAQTFSDHGHYPIVMEDVPDEKTDADLMRKFDRMLDTMGVTDIVVYYPQVAKMQTTFDEFILLAKRTETQSIPQVWILHDADVARIDGFQAVIKEKGDRSRYLTAIPRLRPFVQTWRTTEDLDRLVRFVATEL